MKTPVSGLNLHRVRAGYGQAVVLHDISLTLAPGSSLALLGRNGTGKSTLLKTIMGLVHLHSGQITLRDRDLTVLPPYRRATLGIGWVPQNRAVFRPLTVEENLRVVARTGPWTVPAVYELFPALAARRRHLGRQLSGGEQQMLAIGRALMTNPAILLLDEPLEGLAPKVAQHVLEALDALLHDTAMSVIIVEQHPGQILPLTQQAVILERGRITHQADSQQLLTDTASLERWLGIRA